MKKGVIIGIVVLVVVVLAVILIVNLKPQSYQQPISNDNNPLGPPILNNFGVIICSIYRI